MDAIFEEKFINFITFEKGLVPIDERRIVRSFRRDVRVKRLGGVFENLNFDVQQTKRVVRRCFYLALVIVAIGLGRQVDVALQRMGGRKGEIVWVRWNGIQRIRMRNANRMRSVEEIRIGQTIGRIGHERNER